MPQLGNCCCFTVITLFKASVPFLHPMKTLRKPEVFCFEGVQKWNIGLKWVNYAFRNNAPLYSCASMETMKIKRGILVSNGSSMFKQDR